MDEAKAFSRTPPALTLIKDRLIPAVVVIYLALAAVFFVLIPIRVYSWLQAPSLGAFLEPNLVFNGLGSVDGIGTGDRLAAVAGQAVNTSMDVQRVLGGYATGDLVVLQIEPEIGGAYSVDVLLSALSIQNQFTYFYIPYLIGLVFLGVGVWVYRIHRDDVPDRAFAVFGASAGMVFAGLVDLYTAHNLVILWTLVVGFLGGSIFHLSLVFPRERGVLGRVVMLRLVGYVVGIYLALETLSNLIDATDPFAYQYSLQVQFILVFFGMFVYFLSAILRRFRSPSPIEKEQTRIILWSLFLSFTIFVFWGVSGIIQAPVYDQIPLVLVFLPMVIFPLAVAYSLLRYRQINTDYIISRAALYAVLSVIAASGYGLLVSGLSVIFQEVNPTNNAYFMGGLVFILALMFNPMRVRIQRQVDRLFFRGESVFRQQLQAFTGALTQAVELSQIVAMLRQYIDQTFLPTRLHIYVYDQLVDLYVASEDEQDQLTTDIRFSNNSGLVAMLSSKQATLFLSEEDVFPQELRTEKPRIALLGAQLFIALPAQERLLGWLALGPKSSAEAYTNQDLNYLTALAEQAALAIERAQVLADKDRRVHEMNVLTRVAQGVNVTINFNDMLELLYAQTRRVINADDFSITLYTQETETLRHVFYVENDERLSEREDKILSRSHGLEREVIASRRYLIADEYERECRNRRVASDRQGVFAWMGVPLFAGAEIIGVIAVGSRDPAVLYSQEQYSILQAVSDQAAGAIVKANLLAETDRRARQLAYLNEMSRGLTSTLDIEPLLKSILNSAVVILNSEAGSLLLVDEETGEYIFEVVIGPVANELLHTRLAPGTGLVGKAAETRMPVIVNNVKTDEDWFEDTDEKTGFSSENLLVVPMVYKDRVIGVIEVINKRDGMPYDSDDQELLTAFSGQAAVAMENARLYTLTDQRLASRVEELSVMQRIDRELNASLDVERAMQITLDWAMRQSEATAGLIGVLVEDQGLRVMASQGYTSELQAYEEDYMPLELPALSRAVFSGQTQQLDASKIRNGEVLLRNAESQIVIPIRREAEVIGLLMLESKTNERYEQESEDFLTRLTDHAAIAISNAQLYSEVQRANIAKSDFVSFVSHELKTPMTSIKGYAELLSAGAVGQISDAQNDFLQTIRNNITRMATLVSDLADVSRIEAGRLHLDFSSESMHNIADEVVRTTQAMIDEKHHQLVMDIPEDLPNIWGDRNRLLQVITNLVSNAYKYTPEDGKITIRARETDNQWDPEGSPKVVHLEVIDTGIGIKPEDQAKIFTQYFRTDEGKDTAPGTGLGLNITRYLVEMQGGKIWFESAFGEGTNFQFTIPVAEGEE